MHQPRLSRTAVIAFAASFLLATSALAQQASTPDVSTPEISSPDAAEQTAPAHTPPKKPLWELGLFGLAAMQPAYPGAEDRVNKVLVLPYLIYRGKYLRAERGNVGVRAIKTPRTELDIGFAASIGSRSSNVAARQGMQDLGTMIEFGPRLKINLGDISHGRSSSRLQFPLRTVLDVSHGFASRGIAFEPQWVIDKRLPNLWFLSADVGAVFGDQKLAYTFYGVTPNQATSTRPSYAAKSGLITWRASLLAAQTLTPDLRIFYLLRLDTLVGSANRDSPLVKRNSGWAVGVGLAWGLTESERRAED